jgi:acetyl-CoA synthetase
VVLREGLDENEKLSDELKAWVRHRLAKHEYPREIEFVSDLPKTNTGKIIRRILRT